MEATHCLTFSSCLSFRLCSGNTKLTQLQGELPKPPLVALRSVRHPCWRPSTAHSDRDYHRAPWEDYSQLERKRKKKQTKKPTTKQNKKKKPTKKPQFSYKILICTPQCCCPTAVQRAEAVRWDRCWDGPPSSTTAAWLSIRQRCLYQLLTRKFLCIQ